MSLKRNDNRLSNTCREISGDMQGSDQRSKKKITRIPDKFFFFNLSFGK